MPIIELRLLGSTAIRDGNRPGVHHVLVQPKRLALLAYLTLAAPRGFHRRDKLLALFWPERSDAEARAALSDALYFLRRRLGAHVIVGRGNEEIAVAGNKVRCDAVEFERALVEERFAEAVALYEGDLLDGFHVSGLLEFERWLDAERTRLRTGYSQALERLADQQEREGEIDAALESLRRLRALDLYNSRSALRLIEALARAGHPAAALQEAEAHAALLNSELGIEPPGDLAEITNRLRSVTVRVEPDPPAAAAPTDAVQRTIPPTDALPTATPPEEVQSDPRLEEAARDRHAEPSDPSPAGSGRTRAYFLPQRLLRYGLRVGAAGPLLLGLAAGVYLTLNGLGPAGEPPSFPGPAEGVDGLTPISVVVLPFTVRGGPDVAYLREGVASLLSIKLDGAGELRGVDSHTLLRQAGEQERWDPEEASALAAHFGAGLFILGNVVEGGGRLHLDAALYEAGEPRPSAYAAVEGGTGELLELVDQLAVELLATRLRRPEAGLRRAADLTTHSLPALRAFLDGEREWRAYRPSAAIEAYQRAVWEDSTFALAHLRLATAVGGSEPASNLALRSLAVEAARRHHQRLSLRDRLLLDVHEAGLEGRGAVVEARLRRMTARYPDDAEVWYWLGNLLFHGNPNRGRSISEAREAFERAVALDPTNREYLVYLLHLRRHEGRLSDLGTLAERMGTGYPQYEEMKLLGRFGAGSPPERASALADLSRLEQIPQLQLLIYTAMDGPADVLAAVLDAHAERPLEIRADWPDWRGQAFAAELAFWLGRLSDGRQSLRELRQPEPAAAVLYEAWLARAPFATADAADLRQLRAEVEALPPDTSPRPRWNSDVWRQVRLVLLGILSVRLEDFPAAARYASELAALEAQDISTARARVGSHTVRAMAARAQGRATEALRLLEDVEPEMFGLSRWVAMVPDFTLQRFLRAELLLELGRDEEALAWYPYYGWSWSSLLGPLFVPISHLRVAEIHDRRGDPEAAIHHYTLFTLLWRDADMELRPLVERAQRRLAVLQEGGTGRSR